jgi:hypothetical protein
MFPCPTSSATKAQVWFELRSSGLHVLAIAVGISMLLFLLFTMGIRFAPFRAFAMIGVFGTAPAMLIYAGNAFGIRRKERRAYLSAFEATQPCGNAQMASVKLLVRTACILVAVAVIVVSAWASLSIVNEWGPWISEKGRDLSLPLLQVRSDLARELGELQGYELAAQVVITLVFVLVVVAARAAFTALRARYPRRVLITGSLLLLCILALQFGRDILPHGVRAATPWLVVAAMLFTTVYFLWSGFAERALTTSYVFGALVISVANGVACLPGSFSSILGTVLLPLLLCVLAPWSLNRIRHT